jgi:hypothetical protein
MCNHHVDRKPKVGICTLAKTGPSVSGRLSGMELPHNDHYSRQKNIALDLLRRLRENFDIGPKLFVIAHARTPLKRA